MSEETTQPEIRTTLSTLVGEYAARGIAIPEGVTVMRYADYLPLATDKQCIVYRELDTDNPNPSVGNFFDDPFPLQITRYDKETGGYITDFAIPIIDYEKYRRLLESISMKTFQPVFPNPVTTEYLDVKCPLLIASFQGKMGTGRRITADEARKVAVNHLRSFAYEIDLYTCYAKTTRDALRFFAMECTRLSDYRHIPVDHRRAAAHFQWGYLHAMFAGIGAYLSIEKDEELLAHCEPV